LEKIIVNICLYLFIIANSSSLLAQNNNMHSHRKICYDAFVCGKMDRWVPVMIKMENMPLSSNHEKFELIRCYYGYAAYLIGMKDKKKAKSYVTKGDKLLNDILEKEPANATALAFKGSFTGFKVMFNKWRIITLGPESIRYINRAYKADPNNIQALIDKANLLYFTPKMFGGNKAESFIFFEKSIAKMEASQDTTNNWYYLALLSLLAEHYEKEGFTGKASALQQKIYRIEPELKWLKEKILSKLDVEE